MLLEGKIEDFTGLRVEWFLEQEEPGDTPIVGVHLYRSDEDEHFEYGTAEFDLSNGRITGWPWTSAVWRDGDDIEGAVEDAVTLALAAAGAA